MLLSPKCKLAYKLLLDADADVDVMFLGLWVLLMVSGQQFWVYGFVPCGFSLQMCGWLVVARFIQAFFFFFGLLRKRFFNCFFLLIYSKREREEKERHMERDEREKCAELRYVTMLQAVQGYRLRWSIFKYSGLHWHYAKPQGMFMKFIHTQKKKKEFFIIIMKQD